MSRTFWPALRHMQLLQRAPSCPALAHVLRRTYAADVHLQTHAYRTVQSSPSLCVASMLHDRMR